MKRRPSGSRRAARLLASALACALLLVAGFLGVEWEQGDAGAHQQAQVADGAPSQAQGAGGAHQQAQHGAAQPTDAPFRLDWRKPDFSGVPEYSGEDYVELSGRVPSFTDTEMAAPEGTEVYGELDALGRATFAFAKLCENTRPAPGAKRNTNMPDPSGFVQAFYPEIGLDHLYERSHLIAYSLNDEAVNPRDLITGTHHLNQRTMQPFESAVRNGIDVVNEATGGSIHVLMRVTPDFREGELVARGVQIEALSLEDGGDSVRLNVYCYNVQPGVSIDYATGESRLDS